MGTVSGAGTYKSGQTATLTATPNSKYIFVRWYNEDKQIDVHENPYTFTVQRNLTITAVFRRAPKRIVIQAPALAPAREISNDEDVIAVVEVGDKSVHVTNMSEGAYRIYDSAGRLIITTDSDNTYVLSSGLYFIQRDDISEKFIVK